MRKRKYSSLFKKKIRNLKGQEAKIFIKKRDEILKSPSLEKYKNLKHGFSKFKRVHLRGGSYVILFFGDNKVVYFVDYEHHDRVYNFSRKDLKKFDKLTYK